MYCWLLVSSCDDWAVLTVPVGFVGAGRPVPRSRAPSGGSRSSAWWAGRSGQPSRFGRSDGSRYGRSDGQPRSGGRRRSRSHRSSPRALRHDAVAATASPRALGRPPLALDALGQHQRSGEGAVQRPSGVAGVPEPLPPRRRNCVAQVPEPRPRGVVELPEPQWKAFTEPPQIVPKGPGTKRAEWGARRPASY